MGWVTFWAIFYKLIRSPWCHASWCKWRLHNYGQWKRIQAQAIALLCANGH
jgi:hypothetical protein